MKMTLQRSSNINSWWRLKTSGRITWRAISPFEMHRPIVYRVARICSLTNHELILGRPSYNDNEGDTITALLSFFLGGKSKKESETSWSHNSEKNTKDGCKETASDSVRARYDTWAKEWGYSRLDKMGQIIDDWWWMRSDARAQLLIADVNRARVPRLGSSTHWE